MAETKDATALAKERLAKEKEAAAKSTQEANDLLTKGKPTPTQEENDLAKLGATLETHEDDGSGPQPQFVVTRVVEAKPQASQSGYATRTVPPPKPAG
jgi:hypothetical protein